MGKTTLAKKIIQNKNCIIFDVLGEYNNFENIEDINKLILRLNDVIKNNDDFQISIKIQNDKMLEDVANILWLFAKHYKAKKEWWLLFEEASIYARNNMQSKILDFPKYGRHFQINQIWVSRNTTEISKIITSQADAIITFNQIEPRHLSVLKDYGFDIEKVVNLKKGEYIIVGDINLNNLIINKNKNMRNKNA